MSCFICSTCYSTFPLDEKRWRCECGSCLDIDFEVDFDKRKIKSRKQNMWRYREALPLENMDNLVSFEEGFTPLIREHVNDHIVYLKLDYLFPSGSFKDRGASVLVSKVKELGIKKIVEDSSGNAGAAIANYCARAGIECDVYVPASSSYGKLDQIFSSGATLFPIKGNREDTAIAALEAAQDNYYASHSWNPFFFQGTKTFSFEVYEQLRWGVPDTLILPVGNGTLLLGAYIGFKDLLKLGLVERLPKIIAVQTKGCAPLYTAFKEKLLYIPHVTRKETVAEGIAIAEPVRGMQILNAVKDCGGFFISVSEPEIKSALKMMCRSGYYIEPTAAATIAGVLKYLDQNKMDELIVSVLTGSGLKTNDKVQQLVLFD